MNYIPCSERYNTMIYNKCGRSGIKLSAISLGFWHNFGNDSSYQNSGKIIRKAFDLGITHFDLANNYGPPHGAAEERFGEVLARELRLYRDEIIISTKAGYNMWEGPYGEWCSKKHVVASLNQSLRRLGLEYVDIFYLHRPDPSTPIEEILDTMELITKQGKALYIGISNYNAKQSGELITAFKSLRIPCIIHQHPYSVLNRRIENKLQPFLNQEGIGSISYMPLAQGLLTNKYINGIPSDSRAAGKSNFLSISDITESKLKIIRALNTVAQIRNQSLAQMAIAWALRDGRETSVIIGASKVEQVIENVAALNNLSFCTEELQRIDDILYLKKCD